MHMIRERAAHRAARGAAFPGFMPAFHDSAPNMEHLAVMRLAAQLALLQAPPNAEPPGAVFLLPAWPCDAAVSFRLRAPGGWVAARYRPAPPRALLVAVDPPGLRELVRPGGDPPCVPAVELRELGDLYRL
eukprot:TRINITY_DN27527_c0_g1_i14.p3 TRINITY_DN27527_c0_g1~~TRINITY_DN27527_c0_g1_i14.p3  ORF type:complete len:131 (+),score=33.20 TRINITY_DN27527_c0_g1_i14:1042-1434(+)